MFRTIRIRTKLAVALAIPLVALVAVAGYEVREANRDVERIESQTELATSSLGPGSLVTRLQDERNRASLDLVGLDTELPVDDNEEARELSDAAAEEFRAEIASRPGPVSAAFEDAFAALDDIDELRDDIDADEGPFDIGNNAFANEVFTRYTEITEAFFDATSRVALSVDGAELRNGVEIVDAATRQSEMRARIVRDLVLATLTGNADRPEVGQSVAGLLDRANGFDADIRTNASGPYEGVADETFEEPNVASFVEQVETYLAEGTVDIGTLLESVESQPDIGYIGLRARAADRLIDEADRIEGEAIDRQRTFILLAAGALLLAALVTFLASRSITRPLRSLRTQADTMANQTLPTAVRQILETPPGEDVVIPEVAPIAVKTRDEVRDVASALSAVQTSAVDLAVEQAVLRRNISDSYINLGRRNQNLLSRQLDFITDLERNEADPDILEDLFKLDHLATRMRRNAESLLVLAGVAPPRQWAAPVRVTDVVRAALGEVEDYQRVVVRHLEPASLEGAVASDVAHVVAELLENALSFSPPDETVDVRGRRSADGYTLAISDNGLGMATEDLARANQRLSGEESFTVAPSRYLGHYVAGHLARRHDVRVELQDSPAGGITARIDVPEAVLAHDDGPVAISGPAPVIAAPTVTPVGAIEASASTAPAVEPTPAAPVEPEAPAIKTTVNGLLRRGDRRTAPAHFQSSRPAQPAAASESPSPTPPAVDEVAEQAPAEAPAPARRASDIPMLPQADEPAAASPEVVEPLSARDIDNLPVSRPSHGSMYSIAARAARGDGPLPSAAELTGAVGGGLTRRVPGAQRPDVPLAPLGGADRSGADEAPRSSPDDVYSFLSSFQSGVDRGRAEVNGGDADSASDESDPEEGVR